MGAIAELDWYVSGIPTCTHFDSLVALATAARKFGLVKPLMSDEPILEIRDGRHILHEQLVDNYVHNDTVLQGGHQNDDDNGYRSMVRVTNAFPFAA